MVDVDSLTDAELRTKLIEYGFPVMPITGTTRKVMAKKLKILMENKNKVNNDGRRSLGRYSSEEESDTDVKNVKRDKSRRITMAAPTSKVPVRKSTRKIESDSDNEIREPSPPPVRTLSEEKKVTTRTSKIMKMAEQEFDTGSDTESEVIESTYKKTVNNHEFASPSTLATPSFLASLKKTSSPSRVLDTAATSRSTTFASPSSSRFSSNFASSPASDYAADRLNQIRSRLSLGTTPSTTDRPLYSSPTFEADNVETPYLSNYTRRLSQLTPHTAKSDGDNDTNGSYSSRYLSRPAKRDFVRDYHTQQQGKHSFKHNAISCTLVAVVLLFFVTIGVLYVGMRNDETDVDLLPGLILNYCDRKNALHDPGNNCVLENNLRDAVDLYKLLKPELMRLAVTYYCTDPDVKPYLTEREVVEFAQKKKFLSQPFDIRNALDNMEILAILNPAWEVSVIREKQEGVLADAPLSHVDMLKSARVNTLALAVLKPSLPWKCIIYNKLSAIGQIIMVAGGLFLTLYMSNMAYKYYRYHKQKERDELFYMVERITDTLQNHAAEQEDQDTNFMVINHVRDMLIRINDRPRMEKIWKKAVRFINENESRVRTEMQVVQGEPYEVWRWLGAPNMNASGAGRNKSWQGQAFETQVGSVNSLPCSPTPCLKIRGMVDDGDRNLHTIKEAVLSKVAHQCRILHCAVDTTSQCVYLKCADQNDAAIAYRSLHGWWYAGNLVTVKYLRLERYMQRYPDSAVTGPPYLKALQPASDWTN